MSDIIFEDEVIQKVIKNKTIQFDYDDLPLTIRWEGRKEYILKSTQNGGLVLNKKE